MNDQSQTTTEVTAGLIAQVKRDLPRIFDSYERCRYELEVFRLYAQKLQIQVDDAMASIHAIYDLAGWQSDDNADPDNENPEDMVAHINGLIRRECVKLLNIEKSN